MTKTKRSGSAMRVIAGTARGRVLVAPSQDARPYLGLAREALFNILGPGIRGVRVLDLYAGSGALGIEALSRGATEATFVERSTECLAALRENLEQCRFTEQSRVLASEVEQALETMEQTSSDIIFVDPPFADAEAWNGETPPALAAGVERHLAPDGQVVLRVERGCSVPVAWGRAELVTDRTYGRSRVLIYQSSESAPDG